MKIAIYCNLVHIPEAIEQNFSRIKTIKTHHHLFTFSSLTMRAMAKQNKNIIPFPLIIVAVCTVALSFLDILLNLLSEDASMNADSNMMDVIMYAASAMCMLNNDINDNNEDSDRPTKCQCLNYDHFHAKAAVWNDYLNLYPLSNDKQFKRIFCVAKAIY